MNFENRLKKELTEGVIRAILIDSGYRLIDSGIENIIREVTCLTAFEYSGLDIPKAIRSMPDFIVLDKEQKNKYLVEVKYRQKWDRAIFDEIEEQVKIFNEIILVYFNSAPERSNDKPLHSSGAVRFGIMMMLFKLNSRKMESKCGFPFLRLMIKIGFGGVFNYYKMHFLLFKEGRMKILF